MKRILHVITGMGSGGAESMIMNWYRNIDREKVQFDFLLRSKENIYEEEILSLGGRVYYMPEFPTKYFSNLKETYRFFKKYSKDYNIIHVHANALIYTNIFLIAKHFNIEHRIMHSHSTSTKSNLFLPIHKFNKLRIKNLANHYYACSEDAGKWCFNDAYTVINNGIDIGKFKFSSHSRKKIRNELNIESQLVLCHVGRFLEVKNHKYIFEIFNLLNEKYFDPKLILVGTGPLMDMYKKYVEEKGLQSQVYFLGVRKDIPDILSASDVFVFPSTYEGMPLSLVEAQTNGLLCLASDVITKDAKVCDNIKYLSIKNKPDIWVKEINKLNNLDRESVYKSVYTSDYNIANITGRVLDMYLKMK